MDPIRVSIIFNAEGQPQLQRAAQNLGALTAQLNALSGSSATAGRSLRVLESDLNRFSYSLSRTATQGLSVFNQAFERTFSLFSQVSRFSFYAAIGQIVGLGYTLRNVARQFFDINEQFASLEITLKSMLGSSVAARKVREELARITVYSPLPFKDLADATRAAAAMPALGPRFTKQIISNDLSNEKGFLRQYVQLLEQLTTFRPDKLTTDAVFALREAISGELRSLVRRFEFPAALLVQASGKGINYLKQRPEEMFDALKGAMDRLISPQAIREIALQPSKLRQNILEQAISIPLVQIGRVGEDKGTGLYRKILEAGESMLTRFSEFANIDKGPFRPQAEKISGALGGVFSRVVDKLDRLLESGLGAAGAGRFDVLGAGKIERVYFVFQKAIEYVVEALPKVSEELTAMGRTLLPIFKGFLYVWQTIYSTIKSAFEVGPWTGFATLLVIRNLPTLLNAVLKSVVNNFIEAAQNIRMAVATMGIGNMAGTIRAAQAVTLGGGAFGAGRATLGSYQASIGRNPFLYNQDLLATAGLRMNAAGRLVHDTTKVNAQGYFGQTYNARAGSFANITQLPSSLMFNQGQRLEQVLARQNMAFNQTTGQIVYTAGSGQIPGTVVAPGALPRFGAGALSQQGLPAGIGMNATGRYYSTATGRLMSNAAVGAAFNAMPAVTGMGAFRSVFDTARAGGTGFVGSTAGAATAGLMTSMGFGARAAGTAAMGVGGAAASIASMITPILIILAGSAALTYLLDKITGYYAGKRLEEETSRLSAIGLDQPGRRRLQLRAEAESSFVRRVSQFAAEAQNDPTLSQYRAIAQFGGDRATVNVPGFAQHMLPTNMTASQRAALQAIKMQEGLAGRAVTELDVTHQQMSVDLAQLTELRGNAMQDLVALAEASESSDYSEKVLASVRSHVSGLLDPLKITGEAAIKQMEAELRKFEEDTRPIIEKMRQAYQARFPGLFTFGTPLQESELARADRARLKIQALSTETGVIDASDRFRSIKEGRKAYEIAPQLRQIIESTETLFTNFQDTFEPFKRTTDIFKPELGRLRSLANLKKQVEGLSETQAPFLQSMADVAIEEQSRVIDRALADYRDMFGKNVTDEFNKVHVEVPVTTVDAEGVAHTTMMLFEEYAKQVRDALVNKIGPNLIKNQLQIISGAMTEVPVTQGGTDSLQISKHLESILGSSRTLTTRVIDEITKELDVLADNIRAGFPADITGGADKIQDVIATLRSAPAIESALSAMDKTTIEARRAEIFKVAADQFSNIWESLSEVLPPSQAAKLHLELDKLKAWPTMFTSKLSEITDGLNKAIAEMEHARQAQSFQAVMGLEITGRSALGATRIAESIKYLQSEYGISVPSGSMSFLQRPTEAWRRTGMPFQREAGQQQFIEEALIPAVQERIGQLNMRQLMGFGGVGGGAGVATGTELASMVDLLRNFQLIGEKLKEEGAIGIRDFQFENVSKALDIMREMTDPQLGFKLSRRGSVSPQAQFQTGKYGQTDDRIAILEAEFNRVVGLSGKGVSLQSEFRSALDIDTHGFRSVTGEVERLVAFQKQYLHTSEELNKLANDPTTNDKLIETLNKGAAGFKKLADEAERTKESIAGRGGVFESFTEGFGAVMSQWVATAQNFTDIGKSIAESLSSNMTDALLDIAIHAKDAGEAFRQFGMTVAETAARLVLNKTIETILGIGFTAVAGGFGGASAAAGGLGNRALGAPNTTSGGMISDIGMAASGGLVPGASSDRDNQLAMVGSGEYIIPARVVRALGPAHFDRYLSGSLPVNHYAGGGWVGRANTSYSSATGGGMGIHAPVNVVVNIDSQGAASSQSVESQQNNGEQLARSLQRAVREQLIAENRQGGVLYNMNRPATRR